MKNVDRLRLLSTEHLVLILLLCPFIGFAQENDSAEKKAPVALRGYVKDMQSVFFTADPGSLSTMNFLHNRLNFRCDITDGLHFRAEARNRLFYGEQVKAVYKFGTYVDIDNGIVDLSYNVVDDSSVVLNSALDRLLVNWSSDRWDITAGRQRINWGINLVWNPNDIFNAYNYFDFDYEERPGTDAIRVQYTTRKSSVVELTHRIAERTDESTSAIIYRTNYRLYDLQCIAGVSSEDAVLGGGWAGNLKKLGFKGEASYFHPYKQFRDTSGVLSASVSLDRSFEGNYFGMVSYLYTSTAKGSLTVQNSLAGVQLSAKRLMPFEHTFFIQGSKQLNPIINAGIATMYSPQDNTLIAIPSISVSVADNWDLMLIAQSFFHREEKSYRTFGNGIYLRLRWSY